MNWKSFVSFHSPAFAADEIKHGMILDILTHASRKVLYWTFSEPGQCAVKITRGRTFEKDWSIVLGDLEQSQCRELAACLPDESYPGVLGVGHTAHWFAAKASELGVHFREVEAQQIYAIYDSPLFPKVNGESRLVLPEDKQLITDWLTEFYKESAPFEPIPNHNELENIAKSGRYSFWMDNRKPVSLGGIVRVLDRTAAISGVYTPVEFRGRGYAGAITATLVEQIQKKGLIPTLYTDLRVVAANRCYSRIGFRPYTESYHFHR